MKKKDVIQGIVKRVEFPNKGIVETSEGRVVVKGVLPDQKVSVQIQKVRKDRAEGRLLEVVEEAKNSVKSSRSKRSLSLPWTDRTASLPGRVSRPARLSLLIEIKWNSPSETR